MDLLNALFPSPQTHFPLIAVILGLPLLGAFVNGVFGKRLGTSAVRLMALTAVFGSFAAAVLSFVMLWAQAHGTDSAVKFLWSAWRWMPLDTTSIEVAFSIDQLSATMMLVVTGVGALIHLYATGYMHGDPGFHRFFAYMNLFIFAMLVLILGDNLPVLFVGWEGVGLCSYLLIGFWFDKNENASAGKKAFIANRIGDFGLLIAMAMIVYYTGSLSWSGIARNASSLLTDVQVWPIGGGLLASWFSNPLYVSAATLVGLALFLGCAGKSAQIPLYVWLPDAMAGPTPVSALIHAATMVTAGVYLVARMSYVFLLSPTTMMVVAGIGALTALFAATIGVVQNDIKRVLAYSTVSQLGYMFLAVGVGAFAAGIFHVFTHAFFKACLFLCAGSVIHAMHARIHETNASQDMRNMGGMRKYMPITFYTYAASTLAIIGFPLTSGFFSKDEILFRAFVNRIGPTAELQQQLLHRAMRTAGAEGLSPEARQAVIAGAGMPNWFAWTVFALAVLAAVLTAFYMVRSLVLTFFGSFRGWRIVPGWKAHHGSEHEHEEHAEAGAMSGPVPHESPKVMTVPLVILGSLALVAGVLNMAPFHFTPFEHWLAPVFKTGSHVVTTIKTGAELVQLEYWMLVPGILAFALGAGFAWWVYQVRQGEPARKAAEATPGLYRLVRDKWRIDELYDHTAIGAVDAMAETSTWFDKYVVDGVFSKLTAAAVAGFGALLRLFQNGRVQTYAVAMVLGTVALGFFFVMPHPRATVRLDEQRIQYVVEAAPGLGYEYRWHELDAAAGKELPLAEGSEWGTVRSVNVTLEPGQTKRIKLQVRNVFKLTRETVVELTRPRPDRSGAAVVGMVSGQQAQEVRP